MAGELEAGLAAGVAGFAAREGASLSRNFANIFFNMTMETQSVRESPGFATFMWHGAEGSSQDTRPGTTKYTKYTKNGVATKLFLG